MVTDPVEDDPDPDQTFQKPRIGPSRKKLDTDPNLEKHPDTQP